MDHSPLPEPYAALAALVDGEPTIAQARVLSQALTDVPALQRWLREHRQRTVRTLLDAGHTRTELAPHLNVTPQRVSDIASGHTRSRTPRRATNSAS